MNTREIALTITFAALAIVLDPIRIPAVYLTSAFYRFCEIPIVAAFLLLGPKSGVLVAVLNAIIELTLFPSSAGVLGPPIVLELTLSMLLGIYSAQWLLKRKASQNGNLGAKPVTYFTALGGLFRTALAPFLMYATYRYLVPLVFGLSFSDVQIMALIPAFMALALTLSLYTIPLGYLVARIVSRNLKIGNAL